jgi:signal transduction histidine kinase
MKEWLRGKLGGLAAFLVIAGLVAGGLGWATSAALRLERDQLERRAEADFAGRLRLALWRLDGLVSPHLAREDSRPFNHYSAIYAPPLAFRASGAACTAGEVLEPSPLLSAELPAWMPLHFQVDAASGWVSPQVLAPAVRKLLQQHPQITPGNVTAQRKALLAWLGKELSARDAVAAAREHAKPATVRDTTMLAARPPLDNAPPAAEPQGGKEYRKRSVQKSQAQNDSLQQKVDRDVVLNSVAGNGDNWIQPNPTGWSGGAEVLVYLSPLVPIWLTGHSGEELLLVVRLVRVEDKEVCQGILLDVPALQALLAGEVADLFPEARLVPMRQREPPQPERTMAGLPLQLEPGGPEPAAPPPGWTPLRVGLALAWAAAGVALAAVGLGGWSLIDLSERRIRFVSAVTHELRTPLTTLRLYLDMLLGGLVREDAQRHEYLRTLHGETDRLTRLVANVLDFSRLERQRPRLERRAVRVGELLEQLKTAWECRCRDADKELILENALAADAVIGTDSALLQQVLGNLIDNACKYSRGAADRRLWVRVRQDGRWLVFEVEDRGPGVPARERHAVFRAFRRGRSADVTAGGVGLGLALARRWTGLLGGQLTLEPLQGAGGACFRVTLLGKVPPAKAEG